MRRGAEKKGLDGPRVVVNDDSLDTLTLIKLNTKRSLAGVTKWSRCDRENSRNTVDLKPRCEFLLII